MSTKNQKISREEYEQIETETGDLRYHPTTETYLAVHEWENDESLSTTLVTAVEAISGVDHSELPSLYQTVDPDSLDQIFEPTKSDGRSRGAGQVTFPYSEFRITVHAGGEIELRAQQDDPETDD